MRKSKQRGGTDVFQVMARELFFRVVAVIRWLLYTECTCERDSGAESLSVSGSPLPELLNPTPN
jgi:hypothetical protein